MELSNNISWQQTVYLLACIAASGLSELSSGQSELGAEGS